MLKVGLTGGIGCGKSTAVDAFRVLGVSIIDADKISKALVQPGQYALTQIVDQFGDNILLENGELNRSLLKEIIFSDDIALTQLENILHPQIKKEINRQLLLLEKDNTSKFPYVLVDVPLLIEKGYEKMFDRIVVVDCSVEQQIKRAMLRDKLDKKSVLQIIQKQASREERLKSATDILDNSKNKSHLLKKINQLHTLFLSLS